MPKFVLAFRGGMPKSPEDGQKMMTDRTAWMDRLGPALLDRARDSASRVSCLGRTTRKKPAIRFPDITLVEAADIDAALDIARKNPIFSLGGTIEVAECLQM